MRTIDRIDLRPPRERPRERLVAHGARQLSDGELLALLLPGSAQRDRLQTAHALLQRFETPAKIARLGVAKLTECYGVGLAAACGLIAAFELGRRAFAEPAAPRPRLLGSHDVFQLLRQQAVGLDHEVFWILALNARAELIGLRQIAQGTASAVIIHPRDVFIALLREGASSAVVAHNHPSGNPEPSGEDIALTHRLVDAGQLLGIPLLDHLVIAGTAYVSLAQRGHVITSLGDPA